MTYVYVHVHVSALPAIVDRSPPASQGLLYETLLSAGLLEPQNGSTAVSKQRFGQLLGYLKLDICPPP